MKFKISYFYHVRNFKPHQVPISTAKYDPKWFHNNKGEGHVWVDKNGVINGLRKKELAPNDNCTGLCIGPKVCMAEPSNCLFLNCYYDQLHGNDFNKLINELEDMVKFYSKRNPRYNGEQELECILLVYETPDNPCSERGHLVKWFKENGYELEEFVK